MAPSSDVPARSVKVLTEFLGTFFLCLTVALSSKSSIAPIGIGCVLMVCVYAGGHISGAHYNPAVTLAVLARGGGLISLADGALYVVTQVVAALLAAPCCWGMIRKEAAGYAMAPPNTRDHSLYLCEFLITFALCSVVLLTATAKGQAGNSFFGLAIGFTVLSGAVSVGAISGGAFNPAVGTMSLLYGRKPAWSVLAYWVAPLCGGAAAGGFFRVVASEAPPLEESTASPKEKDESSKTDAPSSENSTDLTTSDMLAKCFVELVGTTLLCFTVGTARGGLAPLAIGAMLMVMVYMGGWISGGHFNPAVTLAVWARSLFGATHGVLPLAQAALYIVAQIGGASLGALAAWGALAEKTAVLFPAPSKKTPVGWVLFGEFLGTFLLAYVVLHTATAKRTSGNSFFGLAIGMTVTAMACAIGPVSGAFNPAVGTMGLILYGRTDLWMYWLACPLGGFLAAVCFRIQSAEDFEAAAAEGNVNAEAGAEVETTIKAASKGAWAGQERDLAAEVV